MYIDYLGKCPEYVDVVADWIYREFVVESEKILEKLELLRGYYKATRWDALPITLVAVAGSECVGTVSIYENDLKTQMELTPWLASLYVMPEYRGQGIAEKLIHKVQEVVKDLGFDTLYLRTEHTAKCYRRLGWAYVYKTEDENGQETEVFKIHINPSCLGNEDGDVKK